MNHASKMSVAITLLASIAALSSAMAEAAKPVESTANPTARRVGVEVYVERAQHESTANPTARTAGAESPEAQRIAFEATTVAPLSGVDVKLGKNPGGILATRTTDSNGKIDWGVLAKGSYYLMVLGPGGDANGETYIVEITGAVASPVKRGWDPKKKRAFALPTNAQSNAAASAYTDTDTITFVASGEPASSIVAKGGLPKSTIVKSKSNITNN